MNSDQDQVNELNSLLKKLNDLGMDEMHVKYMKEAELFRGLLKNILYKSTSIYQIGTNPKDLSDRGKEIMLDRASVAVFLVEDLLTDEFIDLAKDILPGQKPILEQMKEDYGK